MANIYNVGAFIIQEYIDIVCEILVDKDKPYKIYIYPPTRQCLLSIIEGFRDLTSIHQITCLIVGTHVPLSFRPSRRITIALRDFYNHK
jgi:hypothetical protein